MADTVVAPQVVNYFSNNSLTDYSLPITAGSSVDTPLSSAGPETDFESNFVLATLQEWLEANYTSLQEVYC